MTMLSEQVVTSIGKVAVADTTAETLTAVEDMSGFDGIRFIVTFQDVDAAAVLTLQPKENTANSTSSPTPTAISLASGSQGGAVAGVITTGALVLTESSGNLDNKTVIIDIAKSKITKQYVFLSITVATESYELISIITEKYKARTEPTTQSADVVNLTRAAA